MAANGLVKLYTHMPREGSKSQKAKAARARTGKLVCCAKCQATGVTFYNVGGEYLCGNCK